MSFVKYMHVERIDSDDAKGLLDGECSIFPKMDGANNGIYSEEGRLCTMSRNIVTTDTDDRFAVFARGHEGIGRFIRDFPGMRLYGEWMIPHTVRSYVPEVWNRWFVFDMVAEDTSASYTYRDKDGNARTLDCAGRMYIPYDEYVPILEAYGIEYVPRLKVIENPSREDLKSIANHENTWMMGSGCGEGIVVKRYGFENRYGRVVWAKVINSTFAQTKGNLRAMKARANDDGSTVEYKVANAFVTPDVVNKEYDKLRVASENGKVNPGQLLGTVYHCLVTESIWDAIKKFRIDTISFRNLRRECEYRVKMVRPEVFGLDSEDFEDGSELPDVH